MDMGVVVTIDNPVNSESRFSRARTAGFSSGLVNFIGHPITATIVRHVAIAAKNQGFATISVGSGVNLLRLSDSSTTSTDESDLLSLAENMSLFDGCSRVMLWSGSYARKWSEPNLLNQGEDAYFAMVFELHRTIGRLSGVPVRFLLQPCYAHILHDVATCLRLSDDFDSEKVSLALDVSHMVAPTMYAKHPQILPQIISALAPSAALALLSDMTILDSVVTYTLPGHGALNMRGILASLDVHLPAGAPRLLNPPDNRTAEELAAAYAFLTEVALPQ